MLDPLIWPSIENECEPVNRFNTRQNREPAKEHTESTEQGTESNSDEEVKEEPTMPNGCRRYPVRERRAPQRFPDEERVLLTDEGEPESFEEAKNDTHNQKWLSAMQEEMDSLHENHTDEQIELPRVLSRGQKCKLRELVNNGRKKQVGKNANERRVRVSQPADGSAVYRRKRYLNEDWVPPKGAKV